MDAITYFDLAIHLVAGAASERHDVPLEESLEGYVHLLSLDGVIDGDEFAALQRIVGRLDPEIVWGPPSKAPRGGSYTPDDLRSLHGGGNLVHWLSNELSASSELEDLDVDGVIGYIRGRLQRVPA